MKYCVFIFLLLFGCSACTNLDDPFAGVTADQVFELQVMKSDGTTSESILPADGHSVLMCKVSVKSNVALYSQLSVTAASDELTVSATGSPNGGLHTLNVPFASNEAIFYLVAPRDFQESAFLSVTVGKVHTVKPITLTTVNPTQLDVTPTTLRASVGTPFSFVTTLSTTTQPPQAVSGRLRIQFVPTDPAKPIPPLFPGLSVAQTDGTATVTTTTTLGDTGTYRCYASTLQGGVRSRPFVIRCR